MGGPAPRTIGPGPNDPELLESDNWFSNTLNAGVEYAMGLDGDPTTREYTTLRRGEQGNGDATGRADGDNSFYRDNADWMPGWGNTFGLDFLDPNGHPSGATAQDRATNYVGHDDPSGIWTDVRANLVTNESAAIAAARARGDTNIGFGDVYDSHVSAYADAQYGARGRPGAPAAGNTFIDPASFALAMYGAPMMEHLGINAGPITGASIDLFNDPTDTVGDGWAKRMALSAGEAGTGMGLLGSAAIDMSQGDVFTAAGQGVAGMGLVGLGAFSGCYNTATAISNGMTFDDATTGLGTVGSGLVDAGSEVLGDVASYLPSLPNPFGP